MTPLELVKSLLAHTTDTIAVTGATGWFGATTLDLLYDALGADAPSRVRAYASSSRSVVVRDGRTVPVRPLTNLLEANWSPDILLHFAYVTRDKVAELGVPEYIATNVAISTTVLEAVARSRPHQIVMASSGAVYGPGRGREHDVIGNPYGALKGLDELAFRAAADEVGASCVIPRVFAVAGPRMTKPEKYALGSMIGMARAGGPVIVRADHRVVRSYCGVDEVVAMSLWAASRGGHAVFDTGGEIVEVGQLAAVVARDIGRGCAVERPALVSHAPEDRYLGETTAMLSIAERSGVRLRSLAQLVAATAGVPESMDGTVQR